MQILGTTLAQATQAFLHPGYISAYPRTLGGHTISGDQPQVVLDVAAALELKPGAAELLPDLGPYEIMLGDIPTTWTVAVAAAGALFAGLAVLALWRRGSDWARPVGVSLFGGMLLLASWWADDGIRRAEAGRARLKPPPGEYAHPRQATQTILYGLIADALVNYPGTARSLPGVRSEIAFPTRAPTQGMILARRYFTHDGWGRRFKFRRTGWSYRVTSAGADGRFGTGDDLRLRVRKATNTNWDQTRVAFYVQKQGSGLQVFFHRFPGKNFKYNDRKKARRLTRSRLFDVMSASQIYRWQGHGKNVPMATRYARLARGKRSAPLALFVFRAGG